MEEEILKVYEKLLTDVLVYYDSILIKRGYTEDQRVKEINKLINRIKPKKDRSTPSSVA